jgi:hypothetical protein
MLGEQSVEILPPDIRLQVIRELLELRKVFSKLAMKKGMIEAYANPSTNPSMCIFARTTTTVTANLDTRITPCQFGGRPDCSQCGCIASAAFHAIGQHRLPTGIRVGAIYDVSLRMGNAVAGVRRLRSVKARWFRDRVEPNSERGRTVAEPSTEEMSAGHGKYHG